ncbi:hypothetical protein PMIN01_10815 [Paraphaeosphaeria minitans]|uniref:Uncharacterized protein n=1 Tax=Paraphaeosphaeria minitans TaxID=565426 RepID=A0A9P6G8I2_9PLEO|nr:hypothetical protein PMIN01_10815 [Paraphaeosphaeria minitans]
MDSQGSNFLTPAPPIYEQVLALILDAQSDLMNTFAHVTSASGQDPANPKSSLSLTDILVRNLRDGQHDCNLRVLSPQDILDTRIERERDLIEFWNQSSRMAEGLHAVNEDIENFPLQAAALVAGVMYRPPQFLGMPSIVDEQPRGRRNTISQPDQNASMTFQQALSADLSSVPERSPFEQSLFEQSPFHQSTSEHSSFQQSPFQHSYKLSEVPATQVLQPADERENASHEARTSPKPREEVQKESQQGYQKPFVRSAWKKDDPKLSLHPTHVPKTGYSLYSSALGSPMTPGAFSADGYDEATDAYINSPVQWSPENFSPLNGRHQIRPTVQQSPLGNHFQSGDLPSPRAPRPVQQQVIFVPQKRKQTASHAQESTVQPPPGKPKKLKGVQPLTKPGVVGKQLNDFPSGSIPFPPAMQGNPLDVTIVELLTFLPRYIYSSDMVERIASNGGSQQTIMKIMNAHLLLSVPMEKNFLLHVLQSRMRHKGNQTATGGYDYTKWTIGTHQPLLGHDEDNLNIAGMRTRFEIENFPAFRDADSVAFKNMADRVKVWPAGDDALNLTHCVRYASMHPNEDWNYPDDFRRLMAHLTNNLAGLTIFPVPVTDEHLDRQAWARWKHA